MALRLSRKADFLPPAFMRGVPEGRGESEYLQRKYSEKPVFYENGQTPSVTMAPGFARIHRDTSPINGGGKDLIYTLRAIPCGMALAVSGDGVDLDVVLHVACGGVLDLDIVMDIQGAARFGDGAAYLGGLDGEHQRTEVQPV